VIAIVALAGGLLLIQQNRQQALNNGAETLRAFLRDAQQRAILQEEGFYWGLELENVPAPDRDRYSLIAAPDLIASSRQLVSTGYFKSILDLKEPVEGKTAVVLFDKISGQAANEATIILGLAGSNQALTIKIYKDGRIE
jgi:hypothetical protein